MAVDFRCEKCGKLLSVEAEPGAAVRCHHCKSKITVPAALASLPTPQVPGAKPRPAAPPQAVEQAETIEEEEPFDDEPSLAMDVLAKSMPYIISVVLHVGLLAMLMLLTAAVMNVAEEQQTMIHPDATWSDNPGGQLNPGNEDPTLEAQQDVTETIEQEWAQDQSDVPLDSLIDTENTMTMFGASGGGSSGGALAAMGVSSGGSGAGPRATFMGSGGNAHHIVYVVDRSGSMLDTLDSVKYELMDSIRQLVPAQDFHVIFFNAGTPSESPQRRLVPASEDYKIEAGQFIRDVRAGSSAGFTDPLPALERAFRLLGNADTSNGRVHKLIYLLTDGEFVDNQAVIDFLNQQNRGDPPVAVNTILHHNRPPEAERVLRAIAEQNNGVFKFVPMDG